ncbi:MAG: polysaccharide deacetylase family protein [Candidatus Sumerlaeota bacterium]|nr:polysaccharide deacetylase family protein [Candidatus Sumerlaeota bacterium]
MGIKQAVFSSGNKWLSVARKWGFIVALSAGAWLGYSGAIAAPAATLSLGKDGVLIDSGADGKLTLGYPVLVNAEKKKVKIADQSVSEKKATLKFEGGGQMDVELGDGEIILKVTDAPATTKMIYAFVPIGLEYGDGGKWLIGKGDAKEFPKDKPAKPFLFQGNARNLELTSPGGVKTAFLVPDYTYHQLQDNREWGANTYLWQFWAPYYPETKQYTIKIGDAADAMPEAPKTKSIAAAKKESPMSAKTESVASAKQDDPKANTKILKWKDGKKAVFMLEFDDSCQTHVKNVIPELKKRGMVGTFYINPGNGPFKNEKKAWEKDVPAMGMEYGNHTFTHVGALSVAEFEKELEQSQEAINKCFPERKQPRLISFGRPGVPKEKWLINEDEYKQALAKFHLVDRPSFFSPPIHLKTNPEVMKYVDTTIAKGEMGHLDFHGVGGDWLVEPMDAFLALLDKLESCRDQLWITDPISWHKYKTEREGAEIKETQSDKEQIRIQLTCKSDPAFYDMPLTIATKVPPEWKSCVVAQGAAKITATVAEGVARYEVAPVSGEIVIQPVK